MNLGEVLQGIAKSRYYEFCGYSYHSLEHHAHLEFHELNPSLQRGIHQLILGIYQTQKMVYVYDIDYVCYCCKKCGLKHMEILRRCDIKDRRSAISSEQRKSLRIELIRILVRLLEYANKKAPTEVEAQPTK